MLHHHLIRVMYVFAQKKEALWEETLRWASQSIRNVSELLPTRSTAVTIVYLAAFRFKLEQIKAGKEDYDVDLWPFLIHFIPHSDLEALLRYRVHENGTENNKTQRFQRRFWFLFAIIIRSWHIGGQMVFRSGLSLLFQPKHSPTIPLMIFELKHLKLESL